jgi:integrase
MIPERACGLQLEDVADADPIPHVRIRPNENRGLKNAQSRREVPLHPHLIELGFRDYCAQLRAVEEHDLFPDLRPGDGNRSFGDALHYRWHELLKRQIGPDTGGKVFHSFRHYVISQLKRSRVDIDQVKELVGHLHGNVTEDRYADSEELTALADVVKILPRVF